MERGGRRVDENFKGGADWRIGKPFAYENPTQLMCLRASLDKRVVVASAAIVFSGRGRHCRRRSLTSIAACSGRGSQGCLQRLIRVTRLRSSAYAGDLGNLGSRPADLIARSDGMHRQGMHMYRNRTTE